MDEKIRAEGFRDLIANPPVWEFAVKTILSSYVQAAPGYVEPMRELLERAFAALREGGWPHVARPFTGRF